MDRIQLLKQNLPRFLQQSDNLNDYVEAVGEFLSDTEEAIINLSYPMRYDRVGPVNLDRALADVGFDLPSNITQDVKKQLLRDSIQLILKTGTKDAFSSVLRMIGVNSEVQDVWLVSPAKVKRGLKTEVDFSQSELVTNNSFDNDISDYNTGSNVTLEHIADFEGRSGVAKLTNSGISDADVTQSITTTTDEVYQVEYEIYSPSGNTNNAVGAVWVDETSSNPEYIFLEDNWLIVRFQFTASSSSTTLHFNASNEANGLANGDIVYFNYFSIVEKMEDNRYDVSPEFSYQDMLYGQEYVTENGVFVEAYTYNDFLKENPISDIPIFGESYNGVPTYSFQVGKMPYYLVAIDDSTVNLVEEESTDPETGEVYSYSAEEKQELINNILSYFLFDNNRPNHMRIFVVIRPNEESILSDSIVFTEGYSETHTADDQSLSDSFNFSESYSNNGTVTVSSFVVGDPILIGDYPSPYVYKYSLINVTEIAESGNFSELLPSQQSVFQTIHNPSDGETHKIPLWARTSIQFTAPSDADIILIGLAQYGDSSGTTITTVSANNSYQFDNNGDYHGLLVQYSVSSTESIFFDVSYG